MPTTATKAHAAGIAGVVVGPLVTALVGSAWFMMQPGWVQAIAGGALAGAVGWLTTYAAPANAPKPMP